MMVQERLDGSLRMISKGVALKYTGDNRTAEEGSSYQNRSESVQPATQTFKRSPMVQEMEDREFNSPTRNDSLLTK